MEELQILLPSDDGRILVVTAASLWVVGQSLKLPIRLHSSQTRNIPRSRQKCVEQVRKRLGRHDGSAWVLWVDSDIEITDPAPVAGAVNHALETGRGWTAAYKMADGQPHMMTSLTPPMRHYTQQEVDAMPDGTPIPFCGFGLLFHRLDLEYTFHAGPLGEDYYYWSEHPNETVGLAKGVHVGHQKLVTIR